jgi:protein-L-isoaspartate(D-aspartate) O-methyltransferase
VSRRVNTFFLTLLIAGGSLAGCRATDPVESPSPQSVDAAITTPTPSTPSVISTTDPYYAIRQRMVETGIVGWGITDRAVIEVMGTVPRHAFVPEEYLSRAYNNHPLPIGYGQTISQPYIVALMTEALDVEYGDRVLEIGTGSGYQAAVLDELGIDVFTIEIVGPLAEAATARLQDLGYSSVGVRHADGYYGWEEEAPFDAIIVTAAPDHVPQPLLDQLKIGGVMVIPVGPVGGYQELWRITRLDEENYQSMSLGGVRFVPFTREVREE